MCVDQFQEKTYCNFNYLHTQTIAHLSELEHLCETQFVVEELHGTEVHTKKGSLTDELVFPPAPLKHDSTEKPAWFDGTSMRRHYEVRIV
jgi:hypothetical protein